MTKSAKTSKKTGAKSAGVHGIDTARGKGRIPRTRAPAAAGSGVETGLGLATGLGVATELGIAASPGNAAATGDADLETRQRILGAARTVFLRKGTAGARMQEIADEADVNPALLHYYFRSKERLSEAVFQQIAARLFPALIQVLGGDLSLDEKIQRVVAIYLEILSTNPFLPGYLIAELHHHPERAEQLIAAAAGGPPKRVAQPVLRKLREQIDESVRKGTMRPIAAEQLVVNLISLCVFPFAARVMLRVVLGIDDAEFAGMIERRKTDLPKFISAALRT